MTDPNELLTNLRAALADLDNATEGTDAFEDAAAVLADAARDLDTCLSQPRPATSEQSAATRSGVATNAPEIYQQLRALRETDERLTEQIESAEANGDGETAIDLREDRTEGREDIAELFMQLDDLLRAGDRGPAEWNPRS